MKRSLPFLALTLCSSLALAEPMPEQIEEPIAAAEPAPAKPTPAKPAPTKPVGIKITKKEAAAAKKLVTNQLVKPVHKKRSKRSMFSRAAPPPMPAKRRVRLLDTVQTDAWGYAFVRFAIDESDPWDEDGEWRENRVVGCAYMAKGRVYVERNDRFYPAKVMLGKDVKPRGTVCRPVATAEAGQVASVKVPSAKHGG